MIQQTGGELPNIGLEVDNFLKDLHDGSSVEEALGRVKKKVIDKSKIGANYGADKDYVYAPQVDKNYPKIDDDGSKETSDEIDDTQANYRAGLAAEKEQEKEYIVMNDLGKIYLDHGITYDDPTVEPSHDQVSLLEFLQKKLYPNLRDRVNNLLYQNDQDVDKVVELLRKEAVENIKTLDNPFDFVHPVKKTTIHRADDEESLDLPPPPEVKDDGEEDEKEDDGEKIDTPDAELEPDDCPECKGTGYIAKKSKKGKVTWKKCKNCDDGKIELEEEPENEDDDDDDDDDDAGDSYVDQMQG